MGHNIYWHSTAEEYYTACEVCNYKQWCPKNIDFNANSDTDSDVSYRISQVNKVNNYLKNLPCPKCEGKKMNIDGWSKETPVQLGYYWFYGYIKTDENGVLTTTNDKSGGLRIEIGKITRIEEINGIILITYLISNDRLCVIGSSHNAYWKKIEPPSTSGLEF